MPLPFDLHPAKTVAAPYPSPQLVLSLMIKSFSVFVNLFAASNLDFMQQEHAFSLKTQL
jgi:hypothetical protein